MTEQLKIPGKLRVKRRIPIGSLPSERPDGYIHMVDYMTGRVVTYTPEELSQNCRDAMGRHDWMPKEMRDQEKEDWTHFQFGVKERICGTHFGTKSEQVEEVTCPKCLKFLHQLFLWSRGLGPKPF